ncbi:MAG: UDP-N-acetylmuramate dehydrogenase [Holosporales bacterium]|jgi:UDP-N-acetylmuramate dehydrogenase|nr:UDP-N-acetylmuramate dehydrogenase [Holosporales bacterium]
MAVQQKVIQSINEFPGTSFDVPLGAHSSFRCGGVASCLYSPKNIQDLAMFRRWNSQPETFLGGLSNVLIRSGGINGVVIRLKNICQCNVSEQSVFGGGMRNVDACKMVASAGYSGMEFLIGIPGTVGGAVVMNAGAHGVEVADILAWVEVMDETGAITRIYRQDLNMTYRDGGIKAGQLVTQVCFNLRPSTQDKVAMQHAQVLCERAARTNFGKNVGTAGSAFKNPPPKSSDGRRAWELIDIAGCRGLTRGGAMVSNKHANFLLNMGTATPGDIEALGDEVRKRVFESTGVLLEWEIKIVGDKSESTKNT